MNTNMNYLTAFKKLTILLGTTLCFESAFAIQTIPGTLEVENYNEGGMNVAYYDVDEENQGNVFRMEDGVDIDTCENGGYVVGWTAKGEWIEYDIDVKQSQKYIYSAIVASGLNGSAFSLSIDGKDISGIIEVPNTGSWTSYQQITGTTAEISAGKHVLRLNIESDYCNLDKISFRPINEEVTYQFISPAEETNVEAETPFIVSWRTNEQNKNKFQLKWISGNDTTLVKENVACEGDYTTSFPEEMIGQSGHYILSNVKVSGGAGLIPSDLDGESHTVSNPLIWADVPDVSVIRVEDTYYMASTTMHMNPGVPIMASKDLARWRTINYAHAALDNNDALNLSNGKDAYGKGSWASSIKYKDGVWYVLTPSYTTNKTHIFKTKDIINGPWQSATLPFYHDPSLLLDDDGKVYVISGSGNINIVELASDAMSVKGTSRTLLSKPASIAGSNFYVECEGSQAIKHDGYYYIFLISWPSNSCRSVLCYRSKSLSGNFEGKVLLQNNGVAQGGIFDTPDGKWYGMFFRDNGSVGRIPYLMPVKWENGWPVLGDNGKVPSTLNLPAAQEDGYGIVTSDDFEEDELALEWQWNHNPDNTNWKLTDGVFRIINGRKDANVVSTRNTLTQRTFGPNCSGWIQLNTKGMKDGDYAGLVALQELYGFAGVKITDGRKSIIMMDATGGSAKEVATVPLNQDNVWLRIDFNYQNQTDRASFFYSLDGNKWEQFGNTIKMEYKLTHFMGYRFGLFNYGTKNTGGYADFEYFKVGKNINSPIYLDKSSEKTIEETILAQSPIITIQTKSTTDCIESTNTPTCVVTPNPAIEYVKVEGVEVVQLELIDMNGAVCLTSKTNELDLSKEIRGYYILRITTTEKETITKKIMIK